MYACAYIWGGEREREMGREGGSGGWRGRDGKRWRDGETMSEVPRTSPRFSDSLGELTGTLHRADSGYDSLQ